MRGLVLLLVCLLVSGCSLIPGGGHEGEPVKHVDERGTRTDLEPLTSRFSQIGQPVSATWQSGTLGDDRAAPGPTTYWIDAAITLAPDTAAQLRSTAGEGVSDRPDVVDAVADTLDGSSYRPVDVAGPQGWQVEAWLVGDSDVLVVAARGQ